MMFVPGRNGPNSAPYGEWPITHLYTTSTWSQHSSCSSSCPWGFDVGAAIAAHDGANVPLDDRTGSLAISFNDASLTSTTITALGYPGELPFTGLPLRL